MAQRDIPLTQVLIVEPDRDVNRRLQHACGRTTRVTSCHDFLGARERILAATPDLLITNLRLGEYNGLHLVLLSQTTEAPPHCIVHTDRPDFRLIKEGQSLGAFFERTERLPYALPHYLHSPFWPPADNRDPRRFDRRIMFRGGRRASDLEQFVALS